MRVTARISFVLVLALLGGPCLAGEPSPVEAAPRFGTTNDATYKVSAFDFSPIDSTTQYLHDQQGGDYTLLTTTPYGAFYAWPDLPAGGLLETMSVYACNLNPPGGDAFLVLLENTDPSGNFLGVLGSVTVSADSGCASQTVDLSGQNYTVNVSNRLLVWTIFGPTGSTFAMLGDVTLTYKLQVSRPPLTPTFSDVPSTDPGFRYVEAVAAAGITAGCAPGLFCPDSPVTRRQMAVFLSRSLGLAYRFGETLTSVPVPEWQFRPYVNTDQYEDTGPPQLSRHLVASDVDPPRLEASVSLPPGALLENVEFDVCDDRPPGSPPMTLNVADAPLNYLVNLSSTPGSGCASVSAVDIGYTAGDSKLILWVFFASPAPPDIGPQARIVGARLDYRLQVSPPPAAATFGDVPVSDAAFRYVEALAASGITGGCGGGNFCPNSPVTRRQMAIFLAKALGLSFD